MSSELDSIKRETEEIKRDLFLAKHDKNLALILILQKQLLELKRTNNLLKEAAGSMTTGPQFLCH